MLENKEILAIIRARVNGLHKQDTPDNPFPDSPEGVDLYNWAIDDVIDLIDKLSGKPINKDLQDD